LAGTIRDLAPDVLAVQEVGDPQALQDLAEAISAGYDHRATAAPDGRGIRVGFLSRLPLQNVREVAAFPAKLRGIQTDDSDAVATAMGRAALIAEVTAEDRTLTMVTCHFKSKLLTFPGNRFSPRDEGERGRLREPNRRPSSSQP
jgi:hypothetical protein